MNSTDSENRAFDPKEAAQKRKQEMDAITQKLEAGVKAVFKESASFAEYLKFCAKLPRYSVNNQLLIMQQRPDATMCQAFDKWQAMGRHVKKGEKGIRILAPAPYKMQRETEVVDASGNAVLDGNGQAVKQVSEVTVNAFKPVSTFDISQTEGKSIPTPGVKELLGAVRGFGQLVDIIREVANVPVAFEQIGSGAKGFYSVTENRIAIQEGMGEAQTIKTLIHEVAHSVLHSKEAFAGNCEMKTKNQRETEAEAIAYVCCDHFGIDTSEYSFPYLATWSAGQEIPELKASLDIIRNCAGEIIRKMEEKLQVIHENRNMDQFIELSVSDDPFGDPQPSPDEPVKKESTEKPSVKGKLKEAKSRTGKTAEPKEPKPKTQEAI